MQIDSLNMRTRNKLYNVTMEGIFNVDTELRDKIIIYLYTEIFSKTFDDIPKYYGFKYGTTYNEVKNLFQTVEYNKVYDLIEGFINAINFAEYYNHQKEVYIKDVNNIFEEENVNYRIIDDKITDIVDENQIESIEETINNPYKVVSEHYSKAIEQLYSVKDYANSIKESISAVEAMCQVINGSKEELNKVLKKLKINIHPALEQAYIKLYAYTCDENGSRHANGISEKNATFEEAKYMLISCSTFANYLKENFEEGK